ncbi:uncharacterized protein LOC130920957 isoform X1 [Corythoichthys intestinalis]|uniref:uncharacterized protein LOC130920957 isoform X1 n=1 Tax=Corythoichthys intestinalis TaxID=161448 RepID=UPI0025A4ECAC|nr:uncharacterized protein LOC130920957 isoform X1 [Corythoichthys intestinalis]
MPTSPVKTRIPLTSFGHLITEVKRQLFGIEAPASVELTGLKKYFNSYTMQGRRNMDNATTKERSATRAHAAFEQVCLGYLRHPPGNSDSLFHAPAE